VRRRATFALCWSVLLLGCGSVDARDPSLPPSHAAAIRDSVHTMLAAFQRYSSARQWDSVATLYVADSSLRWIENGRLVMRSTASLEQALRSLPATTSIETVYDTLEITPIAPGVASVLAYYHTTFKDSTRGNATFGGLLTMTIVHQPGGWRFLNGHTSSPPKA
jgi:SnoaL-like domain